MTEIEQAEAVILGLNPCVTCGRGTPVIYRGCAACWRSIKSNIHVVSEDLVSRTVDLQVGGHRINSVPFDVWCDI